MSNSEEPSCKYIESFELIQNSFTFVGFTTKLPNLGRNMRNWVKNDEDQHINQ